MKKVLRFFFKIWLIERSETTQKALGHDAPLAYLGMEHLFVKIEFFAMDNCNSGKEKESSKILIP